MYNDLTDIISECCESSIVLKRLIIIFKSLKIRFLNSSLEEMSHLV